MIARLQPAAADRGSPHEPPRVVPRHGRAHVGVVDRGARRARAARARAGHRAADPLDAEPPGACAGDEGDPAEVEARPRAAERGADEVLPREQDQSRGLVPADRPPDPDLHLALLRPPRLRGGDLPAVPRLVARVPRPRRHHGADDRRLGPAAARRLRDQPADLVVLHVDVDAEGAADPAARPADRLHPVHPQLPLGPDDLLADDEPVDDGPGARHAQADAEAQPHGAAGAALLADAAQGRAGRPGDRSRSRRPTPTPTEPRRPTAPAPWSQGRRGA